MRVVVNRASVAEHVCRVEFTCPLGSAWGYWHGDPPDGGSSYDIELGLAADEVVRLIAAPRLESGLSIGVTAGGAVTLCGVVVSIEDGCTVLQLGDSVLLVDVDSPDTPAGTTVALEMRSVGLFPFTL